MTTCAEEGAAVACVHLSLAHSDVPCEDRSSPDERSSRTMRALRGTRRLADVAAATGVSAPHLSEIERGRRLPTASERSALEAFYGGRIEYPMEPVISKEET